ncbi:hypothetical protein GCM10020001_119500 [Nonomuraea salmonea]
MAVAAAAGLVLRVRDAVAVHAVGGGAGQAQAGGDEPAQRAGRCEGQAIAEQRARGSAADDDLPGGRAEVVLLVLVVGAAPAAARLVVLVAGVVLAADVLVGGSASS